MREAIGLLLISALNAGSVGTANADGLPLFFVSDFNPQIAVDQPLTNKGEWNNLRYENGFGPAPHCYCQPQDQLTRSCIFDSFWDATGGRPPTDYAGTWGYGPDWCHAWGARVEWLLWFSRGRNTPALVTTSPAGTPRAAAGVLGQSTTSTIYGDEPIGENPRHGARVSVSHVLGDGAWLATGRFWGVEDGSVLVATNSAVIPILARPFVNASIGVQDSFLVAFPGVTTPGAISVLSKNDLLGADAWLSHNAYFDRYCSIDILGGYQFTRLDDSIAIRSTSTSVDPNALLPVGTTLGVFDAFRTQNEFHAGSVGFLADFRKDCLSLEVLGKVAFGDMRQAVIIIGRTTTTPPGGAAATTNSGLLTLPSNIGSYERHRFAVAPELNINGVVHFNPQWRAMVGYSFLYWSNVVLAGNQIDTNLNLSQLPGLVVGANRPVFSFQRSDFLVQGISFAVEHRW